ncbi:MAG: tRNA (N6-isopentenyl adenosine(37)-C2)-methylthiotransferase MiaB [Candidatus Coatesbacteria bacterium]|nr:tRNA (N6-isopentenyl adenosine(37)-C2)-methylthiotransferase MiaB [Candidatus Coatesbacteria bacterium]
MNRADADRIRTDLSNSGFTEIEKNEIPDIIILLSCSVRQHAVERLHGRLWSLANIKRIKPELKFVLVGCLAQEKKSDLFDKYPFLNLVIGTDQINLVADLIIRNYNGLYTVQHNENIPLNSFKLTRSDPFKADIPIMRGCNNFCTYCIVPYVRGRERSRCKEEIIKEIDNLPETTKEILLLGQNVNSYIFDNLSFSELLDLISKKYNNLRIRFLTSHPKDLDLKTIEVMASNDNICKHIHLPIQSASDRILELMNRKYTFSEFDKKVEQLKKFIPSISLSTDIIAGFPSETEEDFLKSLNSISHFGFCSAFTYKYSPRNGTKASEFINQIPEEIRKERLKRLIQEVEKEVILQTQKQIGKKSKVLLEGKSHYGNTCMGRDEANRVIHIKNVENLIGEVIEVKITSSSGWNLYGDLIPE